MVVSSLILDSSITWGRTQTTDIEIQLNNGAPMRGLFQSLSCPQASILSRVIEGAEAAIWSQEGSMTHTLEMEPANRKITITNVF